jgi:hypothetical protein
MAWCCCSSVFFASVPNDEGVVVSSSYFSVPFVSSFPVSLSCMHCDVFVLSLFLLYITIRCHEAIVLLYVAILCHEALVLLYVAIRCLDAFTLPPRQHPRTSLCVTIACGRSCSLLLVCPQFIRGRKCRQGPTVGAGASKSVQFGGCTANGTTLVSSSSTVSLPARGGGHQILCRCTYIVIFVPTTLSFSLSYRNTNTGVHFTIENPH